jgi:hypothetical protein
MNVGYLEKLCATLLCAFGLPLAAQADTDACTLLTAAQVGAAAGVPVSAGKHVTPTFVKTCTWTPSGTSEVVAITLNLQTAAAYDGGKRMATEMAAGGASITPAAVGDDGYYFVTGDQVALLVKKGELSFKVAVYAKLPVAKKEAMELALARPALGKLG